MEAIASLWPLWLILLLASAGYAMYNQVKRMKGMLGQGDQDPFEAFGAGLGKLAAAGFVALASSILLIIAVVYAVTH